MATEPERMTAMSKMLSHCPVCSWTGSLRDEDTQRPAICSACGEQLEDIFLTPLSCGQLLSALSLHQTDDDVEAMWAGLKHKYGWTDDLRQDFRLGFWGKEWLMEIG